MNVRLAMIGSWGDMQPLRALALELRALGNRAGALQIAARSIAEAQNIPYVFAAYPPAVLPSAKYPRPKPAAATQSPCRSRTPEALERI